MDGEIETAWIAYGRIREMERLGWWQVPHAAEPGRVLMAVEAASLHWLPGRSPPWPIGADDTVTWPPDLPEQCESPIERKFIGGLLALHAGRRCQVRFVPGGEVSGRFAAMKDARRYPGMWLHVFPQARVKNYRLDFLAVVTAQNPTVWPEHVNHHRLLAIECDGFAFHQDKWKDFFRDQDIGSRNIETIRLTGSEIWNDPVWCGERVLRRAVELVFPTLREQYQYCTQWPEGRMPAIHDVLAAWSACYREAADGEAAP